MLKINHKQIFFIIFFVLAGINIVGAEDFEINYEGHLGGSIGNILVQGNCAYISQGQDFVLLDISNADEVLELGRLHTTGYINEICILENLAYLITDCQFLILDISNVSAPTVVGQYESYDLLSFQILEKQAYILSHMGGCIEIINISDSANPTLIGTYQIMMDIATNVYISGNQLYLSTWGGIEIIDVSNPSLPEHLGSYYTNSDAMCACVSGDRAYVCDAINTFYVLNVSDPTVPTLITKIQLKLSYTYSSRAISLSGDTAYIANGNSGLVTIDLREPESLSFMQYSTYCALDVCISENRAYLADISGLQIFDISNPLIPAFIGRYDTVLKVEAVHGSGDLVYAGGEGGFSIIDVSNPKLPKLRGKCAINEWAVGVFVSGTRAYVNSYRLGKINLEIINVSDPTAPLLTGKYGLVEGTGVYVSEDMAYVAGGRSGLVILNVSNEKAPEFVSSCATSDGFTSGYANSVYIDGPLAYVTDIYSGLAIINISSPSSPRITGKYYIENEEFKDVFVSEGLAYVAVSKKYFGNRNGLLIINVSDSANPSILSRYDTKTGAKNICVSEDLAYLCAGSLLVFNVSDPAVPVLIKECSTGPDEYLEDVYVYGNSVYLGTSRGISVLKTNMQVFDNTSEDWNPWNNPDSEGGEAIKSSELQEAIYCWLNDKPAPETGDEMDVAKLQELIYAWLSN